MVSSCLFSSLMLELTRSWLVLTALNLSNFATNGPLPSDHIPTNRTFRTAYLSPFAANVQFQRTLHLACSPLVSISHAVLLVLACESAPEPQIRIVVNDGVTPLDSVRGCPAEDPHGLCPVSTFVSSQRETIGKTDWTWACHGQWDVPTGHGWNTTTGEPPEKQ